MFRRFITCLWSVFFLSTNTAASTQNALVDFKGNISVHGKSFEFTGNSEDLLQLYEGEDDSLANKVAFESELSFRVEKFSDVLKNSENIARLVWKEFVDMRTDAPFPCGVVGLGKITTEKDDDFYSIIGEGDGTQDTCTGLGAPGMWNYLIRVKYDESNNSGTLIFHSNLN